jgi:hypothetical protein
MGIKKTRRRIKGLSKDGGQAKFTENLCASLYYKNVSNEYTFILIHLAGQYLS